MKKLSEILKKFNKLAGIENSPNNLDDEKTEYLIQVTFSIESVNEHQSIKNFKSTTNRYYYHPEESHPPVKAHYHVIPKNGKKEIYAINIDGTAHHQKNKGHEIPKKEANELRKLGVNISDNNIIEYYSCNRDLLLESIAQNDTIYIKLK